MIHVTEKERNVFRYALDDSIMFADPIRVHRRLLLALDGDPQQWLAMYRSPAPGPRSDAVERLVPATLAAFELPAFDTTTGEGMLEDGTLDLLRVYLEWMAAKKKIVANSPTSSPVSDPASFSDAPSITPASSASGSTSEECGCNGPMP